MSFVRCHALSMHLSGWPQAGAFQPHCPGGAPRTAHSFGQLLRVACALGCSELHVQVKRHTQSRSPRASNWTPPVAGVSFSRKYVCSFIAACRSVQNVCPLLLPQQPLGWRKPCLHSHPYFFNTISLLVWQQSLHPVDARPARSWVTVGPKACLGLLRGHRTLSLPREHNASTCLCSSSGSPFEPQMTKYHGLLWTFWFLIYKHDFCYNPQWGF